MNEQLMQFIWQGRYLGSTPYFTTKGEQLEIICQGDLNTNQGPDFLNARIKINQTILIGNIELHIRASDWHRHLHEEDPNFQNIILHVIWENDRSVKDGLGFELPALCLQPYVSNILLERYRNLMKGQQFYKPCQQYLPVLNHLQWLAWKDRLVTERLQRRALKIKQCLKETKQDWETVFWWLLAENFGLKINGLLFESVARSVPIKILAKHKNQIQQLEAILLGQANLLNGNYEEDKYAILLQKEYGHLKNKYRLPRLMIQPAFLRMRPASFPGLRMAQLAKLLQSTDHLFAKVKDCTELSSIQKMLSVHPNDYWLYHYRINEFTAHKEKYLGAQMINSVIINTIVPVLFAYGEKMQESDLQEKAMNWLLELGSEKNKITGEWESYKIMNRTAFDSQALLELTQMYCGEKRCLNCAVGSAILSNIAP
ncbi:MAG: DUF2851 family protein [Chitinophagaceae bacterium]|nr:DUF2851 family protein [Chitinophagaceae bacterium]